MNRKTLSSFAAALGLLWAIGADAVTISASPRGSYCNQDVIPRPGPQPPQFNFCTVGAGEPTGNYLTGAFDAFFPFDREYRSFFIFDLSGVSGTIVGASLFFTFDPREPGFRSEDASETLKFYSVDSTTAAALSSGTAGESGFADLGSGTEYASFTSAAGGLSALTVAFNAAGVAAADAAVGGVFAVGGALSTLSFTQPHEYIFGFSDGTLSQLVLEVQSVSESSTFTLLIPGLIGLLYLRKARRRV